MNNLVDKTGSLVYDTFFDIIGNVGGVTYFMTQNQKGNYDVSASDYSHDYVAYRTSLFHLMDTTSYRLFISKTRRLGFVVTQEINSENISLLSVFSIPELYSTKDMGNMVIEGCGEIKAKTLLPMVVYNHWNNKHTYNIIDLINNKLVLNYPCSYAKLNKNRPEEYIDIIKIDNKEMVTVDRNGVRVEDTSLKPTEYDTIAVGNEKLYIRKNLNNTYTLYKDTQNDRSGFDESDKIIEFDRMISNDNGHNVKIDCGATIETLRKNGGTIYSRLFEPRDEDETYKKVKIDRDVVLKSDDAIYLLDVDNISTKLVYEIGKNDLGDFYPHLLITNYGKIKYMTTKSVTDNRKLYVIDTDGNVFHELTDIEDINTNSVKNSCFFVVKKKNDENVYMFDDNTKTIVNKTENAASFKTCSLYGDKYIRLFIVDNDNNATMYDRDGVLMNEDGYKYKAITYTPHNDIQTNILFCKNTETSDVYVFPSIEHIKSAKPMDKCKLTYPDGRPFDVKNAIKLKDGYISMLNYTYAIVCTNKIDEKYIFVGYHLLSDYKTNTLQSFGPFKELSAKSKINLFDTSSKESLKQSSIIDVVDMNDNAYSIYFSHDKATGIFKTHKLKSKNYE